MKKYHSFERAVFEGGINGPGWQVVDEQGQVLAPVTEVVTLEYPLDGGDVVSTDFQRVVTCDVFSKNGTLVGEVVEYQHEQ